MLLTLSVCVLPVPTAGVFQVHLVDRGLYPAETMPLGQWSYIRFYETSLAPAVAEFVWRFWSLVNRMH